MNSTKSTKESESSKDDTTTTRAESVLRTNNLVTNPLSSTTMVRSNDTTSETFGSNDNSTTSRSLGDDQMLLDGVNSDPDNDDDDHNEDSLGSVQLYNEEGRLQDDYKTKNHNENVSSFGNPTEGNPIPIDCRHAPLQEILHNLQRNDLNLFGRSLTKDEIHKVVRCLEGNTIVESFNLCLKHITDTTGGIQLAQSIQANTTLKELDLGWNKLSDRTVIALSQGLLRNRRNSLRVLNLCGNEISTVGGVALVKTLRTTNTLTSLNLGFNPVSDATATELASWIGSDEGSSLQTLDLSSCDVTTIGIRKLSLALKNNSTLKRLLLGNNHISDLGAEELVEALEQNKTLKTLNLDYNEISDVGAQALAKALAKNATLQFLGINENRIQDAGATALAQACSINGGVTIDLERNPISSAISKQTARVLDLGHDDAFSMLYGLNGEQVRELAFEEYKRMGVENRTPLAWMYRSGCGTEVSIKMAKQCLVEAIAENPLPGSLFVLADILASSTDKADLQKAQALVAQIPDHSDIYRRGQWLLPFIERQLEVLADMENEGMGDLRPDFIHDADLQLVAYIGRGQFGRVYLGLLQRWKEQARWVAVKFLSVDLIETEKDQATLLLCERFTWRMIVGCGAPNLAKYIGFVDDLGNHQRGFVFELCADTSKVEEKALEAVKKFTSVHFIDNLDALPDWSEQVPSSLRSMVVMAPKRLFSVSKIVGMLCKVAEALAGVHARGFLHRDIADRNVLCDNLGNVQLTDMGLAKFVAGGVGSDGVGYDPIDKYQCYLTPGHHYALAWHAPECIGRRHQVQDQKFKAIFSTNSDVYSFGTLMWQCFAHRDPFDEDRFKPEDYGNTTSLERAAEALMLAILNCERPDLDELDGDTPERLIDLISRCWETNPEDRPTLGHIVSELGEIEQESMHSKRVSQVKRRAKECKAKWFDVAPLYWPIPPKNRDQNQMGYSSRLMHHQQFPPSSELAARVDMLIERADAMCATKVDSGSCQDNPKARCALLREMQDVEKGLMQWLAGLAENEVERQQIPNPDDTTWIRRIYLFYHKLVPLLKNVLTELRNTGQLLPPPEVFVSHTGCDKYAYAAPLANHLTNMGINNVFIDMELPIGSKGDDEMMWAAVSCKHFWCVSSRPFIARWYPMRELMIGCVRHMQESTQDFTLLLDCLEQGRNPNGTWMEILLTMRSLQLYQENGKEHSFPAGIQKGRDEPFDKRIKRIAALVRKGKSERKRKISSIDGERD